MVTLTLRVLSRPEISRVSQIYRSLGLDYDERVLPSIGNEVLKATVAQFDGAWAHLEQLSLLRRQPGAAEAVRSAETAMHSPIAILALDPLTLAQRPSSSRNERSSRRVSARTC